MTKNIKKRLIIYTFLIFVLFWAGISLELFDFFNYYDKILHFIGGVWSGLIIIGFYQQYKDKIPLFRALKKNPIKILTLLVIGVAVGWEIFEFLLVHLLESTYSAAPNLQPSTFDTITDMIMAVLGVLFLSYEIKIKNLFS